MRLHRRLALALTTALVATAVAVVVPVSTAQAAAPTTGRYTPIDTTRVWSGGLTTTPKVVRIAGNAGVPANATAVVVNVEVAKPTAAGYVRVTPAGKDATVATQDFAAGQTIANLVTVRLVDGSIQAKLSAGTANGYFDVAGYYADGSGATYTPLDAARVFSGTVGTTPVPVPLAGLAGVPADATAVAVNVEVSGPTAAGYVRVTPAGQDPQVVTQLYSAGQSLSNLAIVKLVDGAAQVKLSKGTGTVYMDVAGYYSNASTGSVFVPIDTTRAFAGAVSTTAGTIRLSGTAGVPGTATAVVANAEVTKPTTDAYLRVTPAGQDPQVATQLFGAGSPVANLVMAKVTGSSTDRRVQAKVSRGSAQLHLDVAGYFLDGSSGTGFGADVSWPQGGSSSDYPVGQAFGIVGVNGSLPNQDNPSLAPQLAWAAGSTGGTAQPKAQLYALAANPGKAASVWPSSNTDPSGRTVTNPYGTCTKGAYTSACSYMYGYTRAYEAANTRGVPNPASYRWWIDVETGLSWLGAADAKDHQTQNRADIEGMVAALRAAGVSTVGIYSTAYQFGQIVGTVPTTSTLRGLPSWIAVGQDGAAAAQKACSAGGFTAGSQVRMAQYVVGNQDFDVSCV
ncbi:hypothetical protein KK101_02850 [Curtobacterium flaccumfaciens pv. oortii]|uniref:hypothetical protein n=1 Tax=Curtobacterium flaccumfaciens TaxID=2035 RepID=UPI001BDF2EBC|nr:hypothetical protein [Curtobacterium flaccumfaciens]MBT1621621.1 hypothetical protein [Curtobacterium flaccumfaciens pv. oortii]